MALFMTCTAAAATADFILPMSLFLNKNWRFKFDRSIESMYVMKIRPSPSVAPPIIAQFLSCSQPSAPALENEVMKRTEHQ